MAVLTTEEFPVMFSKRLFDVIFQIRVCLLQSGSISTEMTSS